MQYSDTNYCSHVLALVFTQNTLEVPEQGKNKVEEDEGMSSPVIWMSGEAWQNCPGCIQQDTLYSYTATETTIAFPGS